MEIIKMLKSIYCWIVGIIAGIIGYTFIVKPFLTPYSPLSIVILTYIFLILFSISIACIVRLIKYKIKASSSITAVIGYILGFASIQTCFASGMCISNLTVPLIATFFPSFARPFFEKFSTYFFILSIGLVSYSLYSMKCFKKEQLEFKLNAK